MEFFTKDGGEELRVGVVGNVFSWGKPTGPAGKQEFVLWKNRTGQLMGKERGRIIS